MTSAAVELAPDVDTLVLAQASLVGAIGDDFTGGTDVAVASGRTAIVFGQPETSATYQKSTPLLLP